MKIAELLERNQRYLPSLLTDMHTPTQICIHCLGYLLDSCKFCFTINSLSTPLVRTLAGLLNRVTQCWSIAMSHSNLPLPTPRPRSCNWSRRRYTPAANSIQQFSLFYSLPSLLHFFLPHLLFLQSPSLLSPLPTSLFQPPPPPSTPFFLFLPLLPLPPFISLLGHPDDRTQFSHCTVEFLADGASRCQAV